MSFSEVFDKKRQVIPRWHTYGMAKWLGVTLSSEDAEVTKYNPDEDYHEKVRSWANSNKLGHAADLVGNALVLNCFNDENAISAAEFILRNNKKATLPLLEITEHYLRLARKQPVPCPDVILPDEEQRYRGVIATLKTRTREYPRNPILWMDLAYYYAALGQTRAAHDAVTVAVSLNSENRYLLRSAARYFMHVEDPDAALRYLRKSNTTLHDPWLIAAEIAIADTIDKPSKLMKVARNMAESDSIAKFHLSELSSALGTIEFRNGATKKGKKLLEVALTKPTENTLAQAMYLRDVIGETKIKIKLDKSSQSSEAETRLKYFNGDFPAALDAAKKWFAYQPFSSWPVLAGSYIAAIALCKFDESIKLAKMGLLSSPHEVKLKNNIAFAHVSSGRIMDAINTLSQINVSSISESDRHVLEATRGAINFKTGNIEEGRRLYKSTASYFKKVKDYRSETVARYFWAKEENLIKSPIANRLKDEALSLAKQHRVLELFTQLQNIK